IGDTYAGANGYSSDQYEEIKEKYKEKGYAPTKVAQFFDRPNKKVEGVQNKGLIQIPAKFSIEMCNRGWCLRNVIIWHKPVIMPSSAKDRFTNDYEFLYFFVKNPQNYYFETQYEPLKESSIKRAKYGLMQSEDESAKNNAVNVQTMKMGERFVNPKGRIKRAVWTINPDVNKKKELKHYATYPIDLVKTPILASCPENGLVLDPFMGSGTTALAAKKYKRNYIGIEINPKYIEITNNRLNDNSNMEDVIMPNEVSLLGELL
ncbi:MAG: site-specific DNA-methyltransferase, partial [Candidatus Woesearchaeota archaeon]